MAKKLTYEELEQKVHELEKVVETHKPAEETLVNREKFLDSIIEQSPFATWISDSNGTLQRANPALRKMLNLTETQLVGVYNVLKDPIVEQQGLMPLVRSVFDEGKTIHFTIRWCGEETDWDLNGSNTVDIEATMFPILDAANKLTNVVLHWIDVTDRKKAEEEKERLQNQLQQAQKMEAIGTLAGGIAHDFNNMLGIILGNSELAISDIPGNLSAKNNVKEIRTVCLRARDMVKQILDFSRQSTTELQPLEIGSAIEEALKLVRPTIPVTIEIKENISSTLGSVLSDHAKLNQILLNLCVNAAHAMKEEAGILEVNLEKVTLDKTTIQNYNDLGPGDYIELRVSDTGCGINNEIIDRIFDPYFSTKEVGEGTGMGLSVIHGIVKEHNGDIKVYSEPRKGTSFHVLFPVIEDKGVSKVESEELLISSGEKILFIDDEGSLVFAVKHNLEGLGYEVVTAQNPVKGLNMFKENPESFDLIITDMSMPDMTGLRLSEKVMKIRSDIPIILCSGFNEHTSEEKAKNLGIKVFLLKPYLLREIATTIRLVLDKEKDQTLLLKKRLLL